MNAVKTYGNYIKKVAPDHPGAAFQMIKAGLHVEGFRTRHFLPKELPNAYKKLNQIAVGSTLDALKHPERCAWTNIFTPVEILQCFGLNCLSIECLSSFLSGFTCEDYFIDYSENEGFAPTLCSYHKNFIGAIDSGVIPKAAFATTTSMICDGNVNTFRYLSDKYQIPSFTLDIPNEYSKTAETYVIEQLKEMIVLLERTFHQKLDMEQLKQVLIRENESRTYYKEFLKEQKSKYFPSTMTLQLYMLFATHLNIGSKNSLEFFHALQDEIKTYPEFHGKKILWIHLFPYYQETLQQYLNISKDYQIQACEMNLDFMDQLDVDHPLEALAKKMITNVYNGPFQKKVDMIDHLTDLLDVDAVIDFCHWGCKQSAGGVMLIKERMRQKNIPMLILDGDGMDRRNCHDGQIKTRLEAFLELVNQVTSTDTLDEPLVEREVS